MLGPPFWTDEARAQYRRAGCTAVSAALKTCNMLPMHQLPFSPDPLFWPSFIHSILWMEKLQVSLQLSTCCSEWTTMMLLSAVVVHWLFLSVWNCLFVQCTGRQLTLIVCRRHAWHQQSADPGCNAFQAPKIKNSKCTFLYLQTKCVFIIFSWKVNLSFKSNGLLGKMSMDQ